MAFRRLQRIAFSGCCFIFFLVGSSLEAQVSEEREPRVHGAAGIDAVSAYYSRGALFHEGGIILQPYLELSTMLNEDWAGARDVSLTIGNWNSVHEESDAADPDSSVRGWYEADVYAWITFDFMKQYHVKTGWLVWFSPDGSFDRGQNVRFQLSYTDQWFEKVRINPHVMYLAEIEGESDFGDGLGHYLEIGIKPQAGILGDWFSVSMPVLVGMSLKDYYQDSNGDDQFFGYFQSGLSIGYSFDSLFRNFEGLAASASVYYIYFGEHVKEINGNGSDDDIYASVGLHYAF